MCETTRKMSKNAQKRQRKLTHVTLQPSQAHKSHFAPIALKTPLALRTMHIHVSVKRRFCLCLEVAVVAVELSLAVCPCMLAKRLFCEETFRAVLDFAVKTDNLLVLHAYVVLTCLLCDKLLATVVAFEVTTLVDGLLVGRFMPAKSFWLFEGFRAISTDVCGGVALRGFFKLNFNVFFEFKKKSNF